MKRIIDISEDDLDAIKFLKVKGWASRHELLILHGTPIPDNATNKDAIKTMFDIEETEMSNTYCVHFPEEREDCSHYFFKDWWNAPYQKGGKEC